jgi:hypothetical protein
MKYLILFALALMLCSSSTLCQLNDTAPADDLSAVELQALLMNSSANLQSYRFLMDMDQRTELVNLSDPAGEVQKIASRSFGVGAINMTQRALKLVMATIIMPEGDEGNATAMAIDEYLVNDTIYLRMDGNWTTLRIPFTEDVWSQQNTLEQQVEMLNSSNLTLLGSEEVDGVDCYKIKADIDTASLAAQLSQTGSPLPLQLINYSQLFNDAVLEAYYWITKDTLLLKKSDIFESFVIRPQDLGLEPKGPENVEMRVYANISMTYDGFNESINIELPAEAMTAKTLSETLSLNMTSAEESVPPIQPTEPTENSTQTVS